MRAIRIMLVFASITAAFLIPHFVAGLYAQPKPPAADCAKPIPPPSG